jgi:DnaJ-class molecular chaperone
MRRNAVRAQCDMRYAVYQARAEVGLSKDKACSACSRRGLQAQKGSVHCGKRGVAKIVAGAQRWCMNKRQARFGRV